MNFPKPFRHYYSQTILYLRLGDIHLRRNPPELHPASKHLSDPTPDYAVLSALRNTPRKTHRIMISTEHSTISPNPTPASTLTGVTPFHSLSNHLAISLCASLSDFEAGFSPLNSTIFGSQSHHQRGSALPPGLNLALLNQLFNFASSGRLHTSEAEAEAEAEGTRTTRSVPRAMKRSADAGLRCRWPSTN